MILTQREKDVLGFKVEDPQAWADNSEATFGVETCRKHLDAKIAQWADKYDAEFAKGNYKNRATKQAEGEQAKINAENNAPWDRKRMNAYAPVEQQLEMLYDDQKNGTTKFKDHNDSVKDKYPKGAN